MPSTYRTHLNDPARHAHRTLDLLRRFGAKVPKDVAAAEKATAAARDIIGAHTAEASGSRALTAYRDAVATGRDPLDDPVFARALICRWLVADTRWAAVHADIDQPLVNAVAAAGETIAASLRPAFDSAATQLVDALNDLGGLRLDDTKAIARLGGTAAQSWRTATTAEAVIRDAAAILDEHARVTGTTHHGVPAILRWCDATYDVLTARAYPVAVAPSIVARDGIRLALASPAQYAARAAAYLRDRDQAAKQSYAGSAGGIAVRVHRTVTG